MHRHQVRRFPLASPGTRGCRPPETQNLHPSHKALPMRVTSILFAITLVFAPGLTLAQEITEDRIKELVAETLRENPELVLEAIQTLEARQAEAQAAAVAAALADERALLERDPNAPVLGNPEGDVTVVELFDYNWPYCKRAMPEIDALLVVVGFFC